MRVALALGQRANHDLKRGESRHFFANLSVNSILQARWVVIPARFLICCSRQAEAKNDPERMGLEALEDFIHLIGHHRVKYWAAIVK